MEIIQVNKNMLSFYPNPSLKDSAGSTVFQSTDFYQCTEKWPPRKMVLYDSVELNYPQKF